MSTIQASFPEKIFFSSQENHTELCDFVFSIHINAKLKDEKDKDQSERNLPEVYINGLSKLFPKVKIPKLGSSLENFIRDLRVIGSDNNWLKEYDDEHDFLKLICKTEHSFTDKYTVGFELSQECEFSKKLENNEPIPLDVTFINFDSIFDGLANKTVASYTIYAKEVPYVEKFYAYLGSEENKVKTVTYGEWVKIKWSVRNAPKTSAFLCDENGAVICDKEEKPVMSPYNVQINEDRRFTLNLEKDGRIASQTLTVNQISPVEVVVFNHDGDRSKAICNEGSIKLFGENLEKCTPSLYKYEKNKITEILTPYKIENIKKDTKFRLDIKRDDCVVSKEFWVYSTHWERRCFDNNVKNIKISMVFLKDDPNSPNYFCTCKYIDKKNNTKKGYVLFEGFWVHFYDSDTENWKRLKYAETPLIGNKFSYNYTYNFDNNNNELIICWMGIDKDTGKERIGLSYYNMADEKCNRTKEIDKQNFDAKAKEDNEKNLLFCKVGVWNKATVIFVVYEHAIYIYNEKDLNLYDKIYLPEDAKGIISIDSSITTLSDSLAILCSNNCVYVYNKNDNNFRLFSFTRNDQKNVYLSYYGVILDNYTFSLDNRYDPDRASSMSLRELIVDEEKDTMIIGRELGEKPNIIAMVKKPTKYGYHESSLWINKV